MYRKREVERIAWNKYGGPNGLKAVYAPMFVTYHNKLTLSSTLQEGSEKEWGEVPNCYCKLALTLYIYVLTIFCNARNLQAPHLAKTSRPRLRPLEESVPSLGHK